MSEGLFRVQALESQKNNLYGDVFLKPKLSHVVVSASLSVWVVLVGIWLYSSQYGRSETVQGWLEPSSGAIKIFSDVNHGIVKELLVTEGQKVKKGQSLMVINGDRVLENGQHLENKIIEEYKEQKKQLGQQVIRTKSIFNLQEKDIIQQIDSAKADLLYLDSQIETVNQRFDLVKNRADNLKKIQLKGHVSVLEANNILEQQLDLKSDLQSLQRSKINQTNRIHQLQIQLSLLPEERANSLSNLNKELSDLTQRIAQYHAQEATVIKAFKSGIVSNLQIKEGQTIDMQRPVMTIVPDDSILEANLLVPVRAVGFVTPELELDIRYNAYPYQKFGIYKGEITHVSKAVLLPNEINNAAVAVQEPVYLIKAKLDSEKIHAYGQLLPLKAGMTLSADINLGNRTLIEWLLEPILTLKGKL